MFKTISGDFDFFEFVWTPLNCERDDRNMAKTSKYVFWGSKCRQQLSKSAQNTLFPCSDHFFEVCIGFPGEFWLKKVYKLDFENFEIFGHSDTISSI